MVFCGLRWSSSLWMCLLLAWIVTTTVDAQSQVRGLRLVRRGGSTVIRTRLSAGVPVRRTRARYIDPVSTATESQGGGYSYPDPVTNQAEESISPEYVQTTTTESGYLYKQPPLVEVSPEGSEQDFTEQPLPVTPEREFVPEAPVVPFGVESEADIDADYILPGSNVEPSSPQKLASLESRKDSDHSGSHNDDVWPDGYKGVIPGEEGIDYPIYSTIPETSFSCSSQAYSGYYADEEARCQVFHVCLRRPRRRSIEKWSFLCPNGTVFSQEDFVCVWWNMAPSCDAGTLSDLYKLNSKLGWDNQDDSMTTSIKEIMENMVQAQLQALPIPMTTGQSLIQSPEPTGPSAQGSTRIPLGPPAQRPDRIPVKLTASLGTGQGRKKVDLETSVPITKFTDDQIITAAPSISSPAVPQDSDDESNNYDSGVVVDTRTKSQTESRRKSKTSSALAKSESEAYEEFGDPDALEEAKPFIVNRLPQNQKDQDVEVGNSYDESSDRAAPELITGEERYPDESDSPVDMPVTAISKNNDKPQPIGFPPAAVNNPNGITIPNRPSTPPRDYLPPKTQPIALAPAMKPSPHVEGGPESLEDYTDVDKEPPGTKPVIEYEISSDSPQPVAPARVETQRPPNAYLPPTGESPAPSTAPEPTFSLPIENQRVSPSPTAQTINSEEPQYEPEQDVEIIEQPVEQPSMQPVEQSMEINSEAVEAPVGSYLPPRGDNQVTTYKPKTPLPRPTPLPGLMRYRPEPSPGTFVSMDGALVNQILETAGVNDAVEDGEQISGFNAAKPQTQAEEDVQYPTPEISDANQDNAEDVGAGAQLYNGNVRNLYSKTTPETPAPTPTLPSSDKERNNEILRQIQYGDYRESNGNGLVDNLEKITPGYIELPTGSSPTQTSPTELPGTESVQAFLTSQKNVDTKQTLQIFEYDKYALFVPKSSGTPMNVANINIGATDGTPAPAGLVKGPTPPSTTASTGTTGRPINSIASLFGPLARDVLPQIVASKAQIQSNTGYSDNVIVPQPQRPSGLYDAPTNEFSEQQQQLEQQQRQQTDELQRQQQQQQQQLRQQQQQQQRLLQQHQQTLQQQSQQQQPQQQRQPQQPQQQRQQPQQPQQSQQQRQQPQQQQQQRQQPQQQPQQQQQQRQQPQQQPQQQQQQRQQPQQQPQQQQQQRQQPQQQQQQRQQPQQPQQQQIQNQVGGYSNQINTGGYGDGQQKSKQQDFAEITVQTTIERQKQPIRYQTQNNAANIIVPTPLQPPSRLYDAPSQPPPPPQQHSNTPPPQLFQTATPQTTYAPLQFNSQIQLPVVVETHSTHSAPLLSQPSPQVYLQQSAPTQPSRAAPIIPTPSRPSGFYSPPLFNSPINLQPQSSFLSNSIQLPHIGLSLPQATYGQIGSTPNPEVIAAIPVHASTIVETRRVPPQDLSNSLYSLNPTRNTQLLQNVIQQPLILPTQNTLYAQNPQPQSNNQGYSHVQFQPPQPPQQQFLSQPQPSLNYIQLQSQAPQVNSVQLPTSAQLLSHSQLHDQHQRAFPQGTHYSRNSPTPQASIIGFRNNPPAVNGLPLNMFNSHEGTNPNDHFRNHQQSHHQNVQNAIYNQNKQISSVNGNSIHHLPQTTTTVAAAAAAAAAVAASSQRTVTVLPPSPNHRQVPSFGTGTGSHLELTGEQGPVSNYEVFYPGEDKSLGVKLTYD